MERSVDSKNSLLLAKVVSFIEDGALVDIGKKSEALIPKHEFGQNPPFSVGETVQVLLIQNGQRETYLKVSWRAAQEQMAWEYIEQAYKRKLSVQAKVKNETKGGLIIQCENVLTGFMPASQIDIRPSHDLKKWKGKTFSAYVMEYDPNKNNLVLSRKMWLSEENQKRKKETMSTLKVGDIKKGHVTGLTSFGAFVDIGGIEGLLHIGEVEWSRTRKVSDVLKVGQEIEVKVIKYEPESDKISLSRKALLPHPWENIEQKFPIGSIVEGQIVTLTDFGAFVKIAPNVEGLLHSSEISWNNFSQKPQQLLKVGQKINVKIISINRDQEKISLSLKRTQEGPWANLQQKYPVGSTVKVTVSYLVPYGAFVRLPEGIEGLVHISDFSWTKRIRHPEDALKVGQEIEVKVLEINSEKEKISFGLKQLKTNPYETYKKGARVTAQVMEISEAGIVVELETGVEAFIYRTEISSVKFDKIESVVSKGDKIEAKVISSDPKERKIVLSIKHLELDLQRAAEAKYSDKTPRPKLGELLDS